MVSVSDLTPCGFADDFRLISLLKRNSFGIRKLPVRFFQYTNLGLIDFL